MRMFTLGGIATGSHQLGILLLETKGGILKENLKKHILSYTFDFRKEMDDPVITVNNI